MNKMYVLFLSVCLVMVMKAACGGRSIGGNSNNFGNNNNNNISEDVYVTRGQVIVDLIGEIDGFFEIGESTPCTPSVPDVQAHTPLCRAIQLLKKLDINFNRPDGMFHPDDYMNTAESWKMISELVAFFGWVTPGLANDVLEDSWYARYAGTLNLRHLLVIDDNNNANPANAVTFAAWENQKTLLKDWNSVLVSRLDAAEKVVTLMLDENFTSSTTCNNSFVDVLADSHMCQVSNLMLDYGILDESNEFRSIDGITWDELFVWVFRALEIEPADCSVIPQEDRCTLQPPTAQWSCGYFEKLCQMGLLEGYVVPGERMGRNAMLRMLIRIKSALAFLP